MANVNARSARVDILRSIGILLLLLLGVLASSIQSMPPVEAAGSKQFGNNAALGPYVDPSYVLLPGGTYEFTTSFGIYDIRPFDGYYVFGLKASTTTQEIGWGGFWILENHAGTWQPAPFTILSPISGAVVSPLSDHWQANWDATVSGRIVGQVSLIMQFSRTAYPKVSVSLNKACAQWTTDTAGMHDCALTVWDSIGLKDMRWIWLTIPAAGYDNYKSSAIATTATADGTTVATNQQVAFTGVKSWFVDWHELGANTIKYVKASNYLQSNTPALATLFPINLSSIDPTFGLTSTGSTSYPTAKTITAHGSAQIDTAQSKIGGASGLFAPATSDYLSAPDSADWYFASGAFTIDFWIKFHSIQTYQGFYSQDQDGENNIIFYLGFDGVYYTVTFRIVTGGDYYRPIAYQSIPQPNLTAWSHIALVRSGNSWYLFVNGTQQGSTSTDATAVPDLTGTANVGADAHNGITDYLDGWIDEFRVSKGIARWTSNFTPPTARYDRDSTTVLLLHMDGVDASTTFLDDVTTDLAKASSVTGAVGAATSISYYSHAAGNVRLAIYSDVLGVPSAKLWESADTAVSATAWTTINIADGTPSTLAVAVVTYWLIWQWNPGTAYAAGPSYTAGSANTGDYIYQAYGAFPATWSGGALSAENWSEYVTYVTSTTTYTSTLYTTATTTTTSTSGTTTFPTTSPTTTITGTTTITSTTTTTSATVINDPLTTTSTSGSLTFPTTSSVNTTFMTATSGTTTITTTSTSGTSNIDPLITTSTSGTSTITSTTTSTSGTSTIDPLTTTTTTTGGKCTSGRTVTNTVTEDTTITTVTVTTLTSLSSGTTVLTITSTTTSGSTTITTDSTTISGTTSFTTTSPSDTYETATTSGSSTWELTTSGLVTSTRTDSFTVTTLSTEVGITLTTTYKTINTTTITDLTTYSLTVQHETEVPQYLFGVLLLAAAAMFIPFGIWIVRKRKKAEMQ